MTLDAPLIQKIVTRLAEGATPAELAATYCLSVRAVELIAAHHPAQAKGSPPEPQDRTVDPADLARVARMADSNLSAADIAQATGLTERTASTLARAHRLRKLCDEGLSLTQAAKSLGLTTRQARTALAFRPRMGRRGDLRAGERYVDAPTRCPTCGQPLKIIPCRACRIQEMARAGIYVWKDPKPCRKRPPTTSKTQKRSSSTSAARRSSSKR